MAVILPAPYRRPTPIAYHELILGHSNLDGYWRMEEESGTTLEDASQQSRDLTFTGTGFTLAQDSPAIGYGVALSLSGALASTASLPGGDDDGVSIEAWLSYSQSATATVVVKGSISQFSWGLYAISGKPRGTLWDTSGKQHSVLATASKNDQEWHHVVVTIAKTNPIVMRLYIDGEEDAVSTLSSGIVMRDPATAAGDRFQIGGWLNSNVNPDQQYVGLIDEVAIYKGVLSSEDVKRHYNVGTGA